MVEKKRARHGIVSDHASEAVHAPLLLHFPELVAQCGADPEALLRQAGIAADASGLRQATYRQIAELLEITAASLGRPDFGMMLASYQCRSGMEGPLGQVMRHARCFGDMLELAARHGYAHSLASNSWLRRSGRSVLFGHDILLKGLTATSQVMEQILLIGNLMAIRLTGGAVRARCILLRHRRVSPARLYRRYFGCEVRFDQGTNATIYREEDMTRPIQSADLETFREELATLEDRFQEKELPLSRMIRGAILHRLTDNKCTCDWVAHTLGLHTRTLHRHLRREGTSFRLIKDEVRRDLAGYYLRNTDLDMKTISERLGFSEQSVLARRARTWFRRSPSDLRARSRAG